MSRTDPQLKFRVPMELRGRLEAAATENKRSLTAEITDRLEASFLPSAQSPDYGALSQRLAAFKMLARMTQRLFRDLANGDDDMAKMARDLDAMLLAEDERELERERQFPGTPMRSPFVRAADDGQIAALAGKPDSENPHEPGTPSHDGWLAGYLFAQDEIQQAALREARSQKD